MRPRLMSGARRVQFTPPELFERRVAQWPGLRADFVGAGRCAPFDCGFKSCEHLLFTAEYCERDDGATTVAGLPKSTLHRLSGRLTLVPADHAFHGWQNPRVFARVNYYYIDPRAELPQDGMRFSEVTLGPRLFFHDPQIWRIAAKLKDEALNAGAQVGRYDDALIMLLARELIRLDGVPAPRATVARGGLSGWRRKQVADFIEAHLAEEVRLATLAALVGLSPFHFVRAFRQSFGVPPHRYHVGRRIARAKSMLTDPANSVTEIARALGFAETSSFSAAFRRITGVSPSQYRRNLG